MNKKIIVIVSGIFLILILGGGGIYLYINQKQNEMREPTPGAVSPPKLSTKDWKDPLGFTLPYADFLTLDPHDEDKENYAHIELTASPSSGRIILWAQDPPDGTIEEWITSQEGMENASILDTTWAGVSAKKVSVGGKNAKILTAAMYDDLLFFIELYPDEKGKLTEAYNQILSDFVWQPVDGVSPNEVESAIEETVVDDSDTVDDSMDNSEYSEEEIVE